VSLRILLAKYEHPEIDEVGIAILSAVVKKHGHETRMAIATNRRSMRSAMEWRPDIVGISFTTPECDVSSRIGRKVREQLPKAFIICGGPHATFFPGYLEENAWLDALCVGEGEGALLDLADALEAGEDPGAVRNLWVRDGDKIRRNELRPLVEDLDSLPFPDREMLYRAFPPLAAQGTKAFLTSRGCPYSCSYCFNDRYKSLYRGLGSYVRQRSPGNVVEEIYNVRKDYPLDHVLIVDDTFGRTAKFVREFTDIYSREVGLPFSVCLRPNIVSEEVVESLRKAGCNSVLIGIECADDRMRTEVLRRDISRGQMVEALAILHRAGIRTWTMNLIGNPGESLRAAYDTLQFNIDNKVSCAQPFMLQPFPGTAVHEYAREHGHLKADMDGKNVSNEYAASPLEFANPGEKRRMENLHKFFTLAARHPWTLPLVKLICAGPRLRIYKVFMPLYNVWVLRTRVFRYRFRPAELLVAWKRLYSFSQWMR